MAAISIGSAHQPHGPVAGVLRITLVEGGLSQDQSMSKRLALSPLLPAFFCVVTCNGMSSRTVAKKPQKQAEADERAAFGESFEFPITNDDPDSLIQFQVWSTDYRNRGTLGGRVDVPLHQVKRNGSREMQLILKDVYRPRAEGSDVGFLKAWLSFEQPVSALLLPRPTLSAPTAAWQTVGFTDKSIREQVKELDAFMQQFEVFSSRFMYHCDVSRGLSLEYKRIVQWDRPLLTLCCLVALTVLIGFFHDYTLPVAVLMLLGVILWYHPAAREGDFQDLEDQPKIAGRMLSGLTMNNKTSEADETEVQERYENERRLLLGRFTSKRLRLWDPPPWSFTATRISVALALWVAVAVEANRWIQLSPSGTPPTARYDHTSVWSDVADGMYVFGGYNGSNDGRLNDLHFFDRQANRWSQLSPSGTPPTARNHHTSVWSDVADGMYVFGGYNGSYSELNDLHFFDRQANRWIQLSPSGTPPTARYDHTSVWSDVADGMYVFGGYNGSGSDLNDLHFFDRQAQGGWNLLEGSFGRIPREV
eukprot:symbB.v1.2.037522.t1/scaffold5566.1/size25801/2